MSAGHSVAGLIHILFQVGHSALLTRPAGRGYVMQKPVRDLSPQECSVLNAVGLVLKIYVWSLVTSFILEAFGDLAILKNPDVRLENFIVVGWITLYSLNYLFCKFEIVQIKFFLPYIHYSHTAESWRESREWNSDCKFSHNHYLTKRKSLVSRLRGCSKVCSIFIHLWWSPCVM